VKVDVISLFPRIFEGVFTESILQRAIDAGHLQVTIHDLRAYTTDKHHKADDYRFGGGPGMVLKAEPWFRVLKDIFDTSPRRPLVVFPTPQGEPFTQRTADALSRETHLIFLCGHYKGIEERVVERRVDRPYSLGDFVMTSGELASAAMLDAAVRLIPGVLGNLDSAMTDSFRDGLLDGPHYTRPEVFDNNSVPGVLLSGCHANIHLWRQAMARLITKRRRPDLIAKKQV